MDASTLMKKLRQTLVSLRRELEDGLGIVTRIWDYKARNWVTCITTADIDGDGDVEIVAGSREGRIYCLSRTGKLRWRRDIGTRAWIVTIGLSGTAVGGKENAVRIIVGTRDGKVYVLDGEGRLATRDGRKLSFDGEGKPLDLQQAKEAYWFSIDHAIRSIYVAPQQPSHIILGAEDRRAYALDFQTGEILWTYETRGWVRTVFVCDLNRDGEDEVLAGSTDGNLYVLDMQGNLLMQHSGGHPIRTIFVADVDQDGDTEVLTCTNHKDLVALVYCEDRLKQKWVRGPFNNRLLTLYAADIDGDGEKEIISGCEDKHIYIFDARGNTIWRHNHKFRIFDIAMLDIDNDGLPELLVGGEHKRVRAMHVRLRRGVIERIRRYSRRLEKLDPASLSGLNAEEQALLQDVVGQSGEDQVTFEKVKEYMRGGAFDKALSTLLKLEQQKVERVWHRNDIEYIRTVCFRHSRKKRMGREIIIGTADGSIYAFYANGHQVWSVPLNDHIVDVQTGFLDHRQKEEIVICSSGHSLYILGGDKKPLPQTPVASTWVSSICVRATGNRETPEIIIGTEDKKLSIYDHDLQRPKAEIQMQEGVRLVRASSATEENAPEIMVAGLSNHVYAYTRDGKFLWPYQTYDHIKAVCIRDINGDGQAEILVGSEDRNIHVLNSAGHLLWRYYLPHSVLAIDAAATDRDGMVEIFVGCADGNLYVFNREGDLSWTYQAKDRIHAVRVEDIDGDGNFEIALGSEDEFELLRVINQQQITNTVRQCWMQLYHQTSLQDAIVSLFESNDPFLQAFALDRLVEQDDLQSADFDLFEELATKGAQEVRKELAHYIPTLYQFNSVRARLLLRQLWGDIDYEVRNAIIECFPALLHYDWEEGFYYLRLAAENSSRFVRRIAVRKVDELIRTSSEVLANRERRHEIFSLLLATAQDKDSEWVRQEAAQVLAHYLDQHWGNFIVYIHLFIVKNLQRRVWETIAYKTTSPLVRDYINAVIPLLSDLDESSVQEELQQMAQAQSATGHLRYGEDLHLIYGELYRLFTLETLENVSKYQCEIREAQFHPNNRFARAVLPVFKELSTISRPLKMYFRRKDLQDRLNSLLEAIEAVEQNLPEALNHQYSTMLLGEPISKLPDYQIFLLLLSKWKRLLQNQLNELRGKAELKVSLLAKDVRKEEQVGILVAIKNVGRSSASDVKLTLLHNGNFEMVGKNTFETEVIGAREETIAEFVLQPHPEVLDLKFEVVFDDSDGKTTIEEFEDCIKLRDWRQEFRQIPNPYSTGTPAYDSDLFYGREHDMALLKDNLTRDVKSVVVLYGQRRSGKTSLLVQLVNFFSLEAHIAVMLDMQAVSYRASIENVLRRVAHSIEQAMRRKDLVVAAPELDDFKDDPIYTFNAFLDQIEERLAGRKLILLIDEFEVLEEQVLKGQLQPEIFEYLRDIVQHRQNINFLFSGTHKITEHTQWYHSVFFNIALHHRLTRLPAEAAEALIQKPVAGYLEYEPLTIQKIRRLTADQPYLIHLICRAIVDYCNARHKTYVTVNDVNIIHDQVMRTGRHHFEWLWEQIKPQERVLVAVIAERCKEDGRWLPLAEIEESYSRYGILYGKDRILETLRVLIDADIIESEYEDIRKSRFRIPVGLTRGWMLKEHPVEVAVKEMNE
jgi:outer membrane protein assembly factor BamB